jgi:chorismate mutase-like protein
MDLSDWRGKIDEVDEKLLALLNERAGYVLQLAPLKRQQQVPIYEPNREREVIDNMRRLNQGPLGDEAVRRIFETIMAEMRAVQVKDAGRGKD